MIKITENYNMNKEIWKDIEGYLGLYQISSLGHVKSLNYRRTGKEKILKPGFVQGYFRIVLCKEGKNKQFSIHRLVAQAFIPNPENLPCINHKDENPSNNCVENLEWCTVAYNNSYGTRLERVSKARLNNEKISTKIKCLDLETKEITYYPSIREAGRQFNTPMNCIWSSIYKWKKPYKNRYIFSLVS